MDYLLLSLIVGVLVFISVSVRWNFDFGVVIALVVSFLLAHYIYHLDLIGWLKQNWLYLIYGFLAHLVIGLGNSITRYFVQYNHAVNELEKKQPNWLKERRERREPEDKLNAAWNQYAEEHLPNPGSMTPTLVRWILYWPIFLLFSIFEDFMWNIGCLIYNLSASVYHAIANHLKRRIMLPVNQSSESRLP